ncbi:2-succinyl-5-enolpyruvyl-6-hydroxy-3-cyclohexene-1-carboxylic-acid synthase [Flammeovirga yaeyamensis]|uniref:2-succinyl-5-enolpyruvyl-6-hydroxy-3-cyclohexene-1-carboxylate synthase n=1 Tax=Flammeovirga yaeyamensis TaxID=367791 RepID=A0AAX1N3Y8_9BACT|nr:2-succinyl-5-enolpyruvyl-6-hydroxy-3-cyclohexene-1-carboxylic-acid synthase [Flammeovirga yaeyamensis]MBB3700864.1 2-succinyl-5-enolpyruvyl-6-hydroxy-3-cyclohexene-1-carboxylate synthase [Flammeovirga yaeyamensis]NMF37972.1 2-succinyl-5-enolpyruvyl-6-hydroxy-3-cyclohexene-1-carboxylic-acid synthase [Flammeovirga yaeyamensis]QWG00623.1 2-succinyl-5-enolpyruvyl-6-hydroxy-3-cyclohexene-1-carboxylic-acid synthase [Flammeovirga yaeyamensis]
MSQHRKDLLVEVGNFVEQLYQKGVRDVVLSPGSRVAPLALAFARHPQINTKTVSDERSAAFIALGIAQQTNLPVAIACTSGTAALNYAPAVAEAYYQRVPLIVITADRPTEWIDQWDGQTIQQQNIFGKHIKKAYHMPVDLSHEDAKWYRQRIGAEAMCNALEYPSGPIQINWPLREPFYPEEGEHFIYESTPQSTREIIQSEPYLDQETWEEKLIPLFESNKKVLIIAGQQQRNDYIVEYLNQLNVPVVSDIISNYGSVDQAIIHQDVFLTPTVIEELQPDIVITFGMSVISKNLKLFLRKNPPKYQLHIQEAGEVPDPFQSLSTVIRSTPEAFFDQLSDFELSFDDDFLNHWKEADDKVKANKTDFFDLLSFSELEIVNHLINELPENAVLHLANSMSVRYANFIGLQRPDIDVHANRGTSGIDGSTSTAIGHAISDKDRPHFLLTGDLAFFYDRNAFWNNYLPSNLNVLLLNNQGGVIFRMIDGPTRQPELEEYFETEQRTNAHHLAKEFDVHYWGINSKEEFYFNYQEFLTKNDKPSIYEVFTNKNISKNTFKAFKKEGIYTKQ